MLITGDGPISLFAVGVGGRVRVGEDSSTSASTT
jgi:hypothetical protein